MGKGAKPTIGYWYKLLYHAGLGYPMDAFLEFRGGDKTAWAGELTSSGTITINAEKLWGGKKDQGGIQGDVDIMFGEPTQAPNAYLLANLGDKVPAWRGFTTLVFKGGKYGAMNPYPQKASYKIRKILKGWDGDCWYPEKAAVVVDPGEVFTADLAFPANLASIEGTYAGIILDSGFTADDVIAIEKPAGLTYKAWSAWSSDSNPVAAGRPWLNTFRVTDGAGVSTTYWSGADLGGNGRYATQALAEAAVAGRRVLLTGSNYYKIWLHDTPASDNRGGLSLRIFKNGKIGMNPAHALYYARTHSTLGREPVGNLNDASYRAAADIMHAEGFGICTRLDPSTESLAEFEKRIGRLIGGSVSRSLIDGQYYLDLARAGYDIEALPVLTDDDILDFHEQPTTLAGAINSLAVHYFDPNRKESIMTPAVRALGLIREFGEISQVAEYPEIPDAKLALRIAERDLRTSVTPTRALELKTTRKPNAWRPNTYFRLQAPKRGITDMVCIVAEKSSGQLRSGAMTLQAAQDIYALPATTYVATEPGVDTQPASTPVPITLQAAFELPYVVVAGTLTRTQLGDLLPDTGFLGTVAADPATSRNYTLMVSPHSAGTYAEIGDGEWCPTATVVEASTTRLETAFTVSNGFKLASVVVGSAALWGNEIVRVDAINPTAGTVTLGRGCADTVAATHVAGTRIWFFGDALGLDQTEYTAAESIDAKLLTNTGSAQLAIGSATLMTVTFNDRLQRPYPPGKLKIGGADYPATAAGSFVVTWAHRNRESQADQLIDASVASITPAVNVRYGLRLRRVDTNAILVEKTDIGPATATVDLAYTGDVSLELWTIDNDNVSWQSHVHTFAYTTGGAGSSTITATAYTPVDDATIIDGGGG